jgi:hypothetical protein
MVVIVRYVKIGETMVVTIATVALLVICWAWRRRERSLLVRGVL